VNIDEQKSLDEQGKFDLILQKNIADLYSNDEKVKLRIQMMKV
jgi:hypothetical protein